MQLVLSFPRKTNFEAENYMPFAAHSGALSLLQRLHDARWGMGYVYGQAGVGKSHFLHVAATQLDADYFSADTFPQVPPQATRVVVDDVHALGAEQQSALFHLFNRLKETQGILLVAADVPATALKILPDIASRLCTLEQQEITMPEEADMNILLAKLAYDRQLMIDHKVSAYLLARAERSPAVVEAVLDRLDALSLSRKQAITIPLVRQVLGVS